jgi:hypothetical protein
MSTFGEVPSMSNDTRRWLCSAILSLALMTCGCSESPAFDIMGSLFPAWIACIAIGISLASFAHWFLARRQVRLLFPVLAYPCLAAVFTFAIWLIFF